MLFAHRRALEDALLSWVLSPKRPFHRNALMKWAKDAQVASDSKHAHHKPQRPSRQANEACWERWSLPNGTLAAPATTQRLTTAPCDSHGALCGEALQLETLTNSQGKEFYNRVPTF